MTLQLKKPGRLLAAATLLAWGAAVAAQAEEITFAHGAQPGNPRYDAASLFADLVEARSGGELTLNVAGSASLGDDAEMLKSVKLGAIQITANSQGAYSQVVPEVGALGLPFLFAELPQAWQVLDGPLGDELAELSRAQGYVVLAWWDNGIRNITHISKAIESPEDLAGMKIRTPPDRATLDAFEALGANPAPLAWSELPSALRSGVFEGQENPLTNIYSAKLHEITPYIALSRHKYESTPVLANAAWFDGLTSAEQDIVRTSAVDAGWYQRGRSLTDAENLVEMLKAEGAEFTEVDTTAFQQATAGVYDQWQSELGDFVSRLQTAAEAAAQERD
ncbi:TRAP transporter substrate-binding protein [Algihabitans albus]|uniref:TRAP transporter substrate-binding protein n=1 Tax=Algihabitans albus TaxID=2164067 RepID=UPI000E5CD869|nr:TRAP transporter substrate-binding protein [Algihabitans albus]